MRPNNSGRTTSFTPFACVTVAARLHAESHAQAYLRDEGHLAALVGDTVGAIKAYRCSLTLRFDPEPALRAQRDSVSAELSRLGRER